MKGFLGEDIKPGDVLVDKYNNIGIYHEIQFIYWDSYIYLGCDGVLRGFSIGGRHEQIGTHPATKEQHDTLMKAIADAGYTFDFDKKELKKIEDEIGHKFKVGDIVQYITDSTDRRKIEEIDTLCNMYHTDSDPIMFEIEDEWKVVVNADDEIEIPLGVKDNELQEATYYIPKGFHVEIDDDKVAIKKGEKPTTWDEDDSYMLEQAIKCVNNSEKLEVSTEEIEDWLKSLKLKERITNKQ